MGNPNSCLTSEFQSLLYYIFTYKKRYSKNDAAIFLDKSPDTFQRYCSGRLPIPVDDARNLIRFIAKENPEDTELAEFFCPPGYLVIRDENGKTEQDKRKDKELQLSVQVGKAIDELEKAYKDGKVVTLEYKRVHKPLTKIRQLAAELDEDIKKEIR